jgi:hypothetical protein
MSPFQTDTGANASPTQKAEAAAAVFRKECQRIVEGARKAGLLER